MKWIDYFHIFLDDMDVFIVYKPIYNYLNVLELYIY